MPQIFWTSVNLEHLRHAMQQWDDTIKIICCKGEWVAAMFSKEDNFSDFCLLPRVRKPFKKVFGFKGKNLLGKELVLTPEEMDGKNENNICSAILKMFPFIIRTVDKVKFG